MLQPREDTTLDARQDDAVLVLNDSTSALSATGTNGEAIYAACNHAAG